MIPLFQAIVTLVLLGLGALYYFKIRRSPEKPKDDDIDPLENVKDKPVGADEPDTNEDPEVVVISKPESENEDEPEPEQPTPATTPAKPFPAKPKPSPKPLPVEKRPFRMGWPVGTRWNIRGATGNDTQRCNDICKSLNYNYFTHNPPPADGGCGCFRSGLKLSQLNMTDHSNAKTRRVV